MAKITDGEVAAIGKALGDPNRLAIFMQIAGGGEVCCMDMETKKCISGATLSHHLKVLTALGLITARKEGLHVYYHSVPARFEAYLKFLRTIGKRPRDRVSA